MQDPRAHGMVGQLDRAFAGFGQDRQQNPFGQNASWGGSLTGSQPAPGVPGGAPGTGGIGGTLGRPEVPQLGGQLPFGDVFAQQRPGADPGAMQNPPMAQDSSWNPNKWEGQTVGQDSVAQLPGSSWNPNKWEGQTVGQDSIVQLPDYVTQPAYQPKTQPAPQAPQQGTQKTYRSAGTGGVYTPPWA